MDLAARSQLYTNSVPADGRLDSRLRGNDVGRVQLSPILAHRQLQILVDFVQETRC